MIDLGHAARVAGNGINRAFAPRSQLVAQLQLATLAIEEYAPSLSRPRGQDQGLIVVGPLANRRRRQKLTQRHQQGLRRGVTAEHIKHRREERPMDLALRRSRAPSSESVGKQRDLVDRLVVPGKVQECLETGVADEVGRVDVFAGLRPEDVLMPAIAAGNDRAVAQLAKGRAGRTDDAAQQSASKLARFDAADRRGRPTPPRATREPTRLPARARPGSSCRRQPGRPTTLLTSASQANAHQAANARRCPRRRRRPAPARVRQARGPRPPSSCPGRAAVALVRGAANALAKNVPHSRPRPSRRAWPDCPAARPRPASSARPTVANC